MNSEGYLDYGYNLRTLRLGAETGVVTADQVGGGSYSPVDGEGQMG